MFNLKKKSSKEIYTVCLIPKDGSKILYMHTLAPNRNRAAINVGAKIGGVFYRNGETIKGLWNWVHTLDEFVVFKGKYDF